MSNAMSRSKSRWKGALLAGAAMAIVSPLAAKAQTPGLTVNIYADPLGGVLGTNPYSNNSTKNAVTGNGPLNNVYVDPYDTDTLYVYATVTGTVAPSPSYVDGLQYLYFNVNAAANNANAAGLGSITAAVPSALFGGGNFNGTSGNPLAGTQSGNFSGGSSIGTTSSVVVGSLTDPTQVAKPRSSSAVFSNGSAGVIVGGSLTSTASSNVVISGNSVSFLVETLTYTPNSAVLAPGNNPAVGVQSKPGAVNSISFNVSTPTTAEMGSLTPDNYFVGLTSAPSLDVQPSSVATASYTASTSQVTLNNAMAGDANLDGAVGISDFNILGPNYGSPTKTGWTNGEFRNTAGVGISDFNLLGPNYGTSLVLTSGAPADLGASPAQIAALEAQLPGGGTSVPEPASLGLIVLSGMSLCTRRRRAR